MDTSVDVRLVEYLLRASGTTLNSLAIAILEIPLPNERLHKDPETDFERESFDYMPP